MNDPVYISGKCYWASVVEPNTKFEPAWQIDICVDDENRSVIEAASIPIMNREDDRGEFIRAKRKVSRPDGSMRNAPSVIDSQNSPWNGKLIGNGSKVNVKAFPFDWDYGGKTGRSVDLAAVQVVELIEYTKEPVEDFTPVEGGYIQEENIPFN
jgi:hypothetical protein